jgi:hypothetical protein
VPKSTEIQVFTILYLVGDRGRIRGKCGLREAKDDAVLAIWVISIDCTVLPSSLAMARTTAPAS